MEQKDPVIVIADTHLGLRRQRLWKIPLQTVECEAEKLSGFLNWLVELQTKGSYTLPLASEEKQEPRLLKLRPPGKIILLGDILELWDSTERATDMCARSILQTLSGLRCEKIYVIGNHDNVLDELCGSSYPCGLTAMQLTTPIFPPLKDGAIDPMETSEAAYLFLHGQQFDKWFVASSGLDRMIGLLRDGAVAFGEYSKILALAFLIVLVVSITQWLLGWRVDMLLTLLTGVLAFLAVPWIFIRSGRAFFNRVKSTKYDREGAIEGFRNWWASWAGRRFQTSDAQTQKRQLNVIYGHTHLADVIENVRNNTTLANIPSWVHDSKTTYKDVLRAVFLYIHDNGYEFFGWDWGANCPRHISKKDVIRRARGEATPDMIQRLASVGWPSEMLTKWQTELRLPKS